MGKRALRLAIEQKFGHRRKLITENTSLRGRVKAADKILQSRLGNYALDECADQIVNMILEKAFAASMLVADQVADTGDYVVGVDIPSLHIRHRIARMEMLHFDEVPINLTIKHVVVKV